ncbi:MAG: hypothetical protein WDA25_02100 [Paracoccaceae bacterium]
MKKSVDQTEFQTLLDHAGLHVLPGDEADFRAAYRWVEQVRARIGKPHPDTLPAAQFTVTRP